jgi:hypothetical protein
MQIRSQGSTKMRVGRSILIATVLTGTMGASAIALESARQSTTIDAGTFGTAIAQCQGGRTAVSGGFAAPGFDPSNGPTVGRLGSKRVGKSGIETRAFNFDGQAGDLVSFVYCAMRDHGLQVSTATARVAPNTRGSVLARCPGGTEAVGGGFGTYRFDANQGPQVITLSSKRLGDRSWKVVGVNINSNMRTGTLIAHAYCEAAPFKLVTASREVTAPANALRTFDVPCPKGTAVFSGGFDGHVQLQGTASATAAITSRRTSHGHGWRTRALSVFGNPGSMTAYAYCRVQ